MRQAVLLFPEIIC